MAFNRLIEQQGLPMSATATNLETSHALAILARVLGNQNDRLPVTIARNFLKLAFSDADKLRMHELAVRNQDDELNSAEKEEMFAYAKAGTILSILKSRARLSLKSNPKKRVKS